MKAEDRKRATKKATRTRKKAFRRRWNFDLEGPEAASRLNESPASNSDLGVMKLPPTHPNGTSFDWVDGSDYRRVCRQRDEALARTKPPTHEAAWRAGFNEALTIANRLLRALQAE